MSDIQCDFCKKKFKVKSYLIRHQNTAKYCINIQKKLQSDKEVDNSTIIVDDNELDNQTIIEDEDELEKLKTENLNIKNKLKILELEKIKNENLSLQKYLEEQISLKEQNYAKNREYNINKIMTENKFHEEQKIIKEHNYAKSREHNMNKIMTYQNEEKFDHVKDRDINIEPKEVEQDNKSTIKIVDVYNFYENKNIESKVANKVSTEQDNKSNIEMVDVYNVDENKNTESKVVNKVSEQDNKSNIEIDNVDENKNSDSKVVNNFSEQDSKSNIEFDDVDKNNNLDDSLFGIGEKIYNHLKLILNDKQLTVSNITYIIIELMQFIEHFHIENLSKKDVIVSILEKYVLENTDNIENIEHIKIFMNSIPNLIDIYKSIDTKKIKIKLKKFNCFFPLCG